MNLNNIAGIDNETRQGEKQRNKSRVKDVVKWERGRTRKIGNQVNRMYGNKKWHAQQTNRESSEKVNRQLEIHNLGSINVEVEQAKGLIRRGISKHYSFTLYLRKFVN